MSVSTIQSGKPVPPEGDPAHSLEKGITQYEVVDVSSIGIILDVLVDEEEDWQINFFSCSNFLLLKAETFDFGEIRRDLKVCRDVSRINTPLGGTGRGNQA